MFAVTEPIALPMAMSVLPSAAAIVDTMISGSVVATETIVAPIRNFGMPDASAIQAAASTNQSPPLMISTNPTRNRKIVSAKLISNTPSFSNVGVKGIKKDLLHAAVQKVSFLWGSGAGPPAKYRAIVDPAIVTTPFQRDIVYAFFAAGSSRILDFSKKRKIEVDFLHRVCYT